MKLQIDWISHRDFWDTPWRDASADYQEALAANHTDKLKLSFLLFDEIEKASDALWQLLLGAGTKQRSRWNNRRVDLSQTVIYMTSNLGGERLRS